MQEALWPRFPAININRCQHYRGIAAAKGWHFNLLLADCWWYHVAHHYERFAGNQKGLRTRSILTMLIPTRITNSHAALKSLTSLVSRIRRQLTTEGRRNHLGIAGGTCLVLVHISHVACSWQWNNDENSSPLHVRFFYHLALSFPFRPCEKLMFSQCTTLRMCNITMC